MKNKNLKKDETFLPKNKNTIIIHKCLLLCVGKIELAIEHRQFLKNKKLTMKKNENDVYFFFSNVFFSSLNIFRSKRGDYLSTPF